MNKLQLPHISFTRTRVRIFAWGFLAVLLWPAAGMVSLLANVNSDNAEKRRGEESHLFLTRAGGGDNYTSRKRNMEPIPSREADYAKADALAEEMSRRMSEHDSLPRESFWGSIGVSALANDKNNNKVTMIKILDDLAMEIGVTKAAGAIRVIQENREKLAKIEGLSKSGDPAAREGAEISKEKILYENAMLEEVVRQAFFNEGIVLSEEQVHSLCASPNAEDVASMISAFGVLKTISSKMEERLRWTPTQEQAQKYYGAHYAMLLALKKIQTRAIDNIRDTYMPAAAKIRGDAIKTAEEAKELLSQGDSSPSESQALRWNIVSCGKTIEMAERTRNKLEKNLEIIRRAQQKLTKSLATAKNCYSTAMLQKQILWLEGTAFQEFERIEALTIPPLVAVNFADPETPEVSPTEKPLMQNNPTGEAEQR
jgi:hypothetical protein